VAATQLGLVTYRQATLDAGLTGHQVRHLVEIGTWRRLCPNLFAVAGAPQSFERDVLAACLSGGPGAMACRATAARLLDAGRPHFTKAGVEILVNRSESRRNAAALGATVHQTRHLDAVDRTMVGPIPVTCGARLVIDLLDEIPDEVLYALADDVIWGLKDRRDIQRTWARVGGGRHRTTLDAALLPWEPGAKVGSPKEMSLSRVLQVHGLPRPKLQLPVRIPGRTYPRYLDLAYPEERVAPEYDGRRDHGPRRWAADADREDELAELGWLRLPAGRLDLVEPGATAYCEMVGAALAARRPTTAG